jgi:transposase
LKGAERLTHRQHQRLEIGLRAGDRDDSVLEAWLAKEQLRLVYASNEIAHATSRIETLIRDCADSHVPEVRRLGRTIKRWKVEILNNLVTNASNGPTEAVNLLVKKIKRSRHGFRNFENYRLRLLLHCGVQWNTAPTPRMRGRQPRLIA